MMVGFLSLSICHQFGLNPFQTDKSLAEWFMGVGGHNLCMVLCGLLFQSLGILLAGVYISQEEVQVLRKNQLVQLPALGFVSLILFAIFGAQLVLQFAALWLFGAIVGGCLATRCIHTLKVVY